MELERLIELMKSEDYKDRFRAEYYQLEDRIDKLANMYEGGGHAMASGARLNSFDELDKFLEDARKYLKENK